MTDSSFAHNAVAQCPDCDEIIGSDDGCLCALCGQIFHMECLDPDTLCCLDCSLDADIIDKAPGSVPPDPDNK